MAKPKVLILSGGWSDEYTISIKSGKAVTEALRKEGYEVNNVVVHASNVYDVDYRSYDVAFPLVHGAGGEDGFLPRLLDHHGIPYVGSEGKACSIAIDKIKTKSLWRSHGLPVTFDWEISPGVFPDPSSLDYPCIVKPRFGGSSVNLFSVASEDELDAVRRQLPSDFLGMVEPQLMGDEFTVAIVHDRALPVIAIDTSLAEGVYDYRTKYVNHPEHRCPAPLSDTMQKKLQSMAMDAFRALGARDWGRIDIRMDDKGTPFLLEANTTPGMTGVLSLVPIAVKSEGVDFAELAASLVEAAVDRR